MSELYSSDTGWLPVQEFSPNQQKHSMRINWVLWNYNKGYHRVYLFVNYVLHIIYISKMYNIFMNVYVCLHFFPWGAGY